MSPEAPIRVIVGAIGSKSWFDDGSLRRPKEIVHATLVGEGESDEHSLGRAVAEIFEGLGSELEPVVLARLEWTWGFFEVASFVRVGLDSEWHVYLGSEDVERARCLLAATKTPTIEADRALLASAFHKGGESIGMPFVYNAPSDAHFHEQFTFKEKVGWLVDAVGDDDNNWGVVFENLDEPEEWDGWPPAEEPEEPRSALPGPRSTRSGRRSRIPIWAWAQGWQQDGRNTPKSTSGSGPGCGVRTRSTQRRCVSIAPSTRPGRESSSRAAWPRWSSTGTT